MKHLIYYMGLICIAVMLFILHSAFAFAINPIFLANEFFKDLFVLSNGYDLKIYFPYVFGSTFALAITAIMSLLNKTDKYFWKFAYSVALLELFGIALLVYPSHEFAWVAMSGIYYGIYLFMAIIFYFYIKPSLNVEEIIDNTEQNIANASVYERELKVYLYLIKLFNNSEQFIKIGITNNPENRYIEFIKAGYEIEEIFRWLYKDRSKVFEVEKKCHNRYSDKKYLPLNKFGGFTECFTIDLLDDIDDITEFVENCRDENKAKPQEFFTKKEQNEAKTLQMLSEGLKPPQIAKDLDIDISTVYRIKNRNNVNEDRMDK